MAERDHRRLSAPAVGGPRRDERDLNRSESPLRVADGAHVLDTTELGIDAAFDAAREIIDGVIENGAGPHR